MLKSGVLEKRVKVSKREYYNKRGGQNIPTGKGYPFTFVHERAHIL